MLVLPQVQCAGFCPRTLKHLSRPLALTLALHKVSKGDKSQQQLKKFHQAGLLYSFLAEGMLNPTALSPDNCLWC